VDTTERFAALMRRPEAEVPLDEVAFTVAAHAYPDLDVAAELDRLDAFAASCFAPTLDALVRHLFVDLGFHGNEDDYYDPRNSYLNDVVERRTGIPLTLSVLTIEIGRRLGVPLAGVSMPGHFLLRDRVDDSLFVDPFVRGAYLDEAGCRRAFRALHGPDVAFDPAFLDPVGPHTIVARLLANLRAIFTARHDRSGLVWVEGLARVTPGTGAARQQARFN
jgi:regulator of sirC expression with transglutaminase-like and TPR domain